MSKKNKVTYSEALPANQTNTIISIYEESSTDVSFEKMHNNFTPRTEFATYKDSVSSSIDDLKHFMNNSFVIIGIIITIFIVIATFVVPVMINKNDAQKIENISSDLDSIEKEINKVQLEIGDIKTEMKKINNKIK